VRRLVPVPENCTHWVNKRHDGGSTPSGTSVCPNKKVRRMRNERRSLNVLTAGPAPSLCLSVKARIDVHGHGGPPITVRPNPLLVFLPVRSWPGSGLSRDVSASGPKVHDLTNDGGPWRVFQWRDWSGHERLVVGQVSPRPTLVPRNAVRGCIELPTTFSLEPVPPFSRPAPARPFRR